MNYPIPPPPFPNPQMWQRVCHCQKLTQSIKWLTPNYETNQTTQLVAQVVEVIDEQVQVCNDPELLEINEEIYYDYEVLQINEQWLKKLNDKLNSKKKKKK